MGTDSEATLQVTTAEQFRFTDMRRLIFVGGCVAAAAASNYASALPQRAPVAVGAAFLGILLMLRRPQVDVAETADVVEAGDESPAALPDRRKRVGRAELEALATSLSVVERQLDAHEKRLTSLSGRQSLLQVESRDGLSDFGGRLQEIEIRLAETEEQTRLIREHHLDLLKRLNASLADAVGAPRSGTT